MKGKKKHFGIKAEIRAEKERERRIATTIFLAVILLIVIISAYFTYTLLNQPRNQTTNPASSQLRAAIIDHLSLTFPNRTFIETATNILKQDGYTVDYYPGEEVTVEFYRNLATHGYSLIVLRVHSSAFVLEGKKFVECPVGLFSSEPYSRTKYVYEQLTDQLLGAAYNMPEPPYYFAIAPKFVTHSMNGRFYDTTIIMMGCEGLTNPLMAKALIEKGANIYISWDGSILGTRNDPAITSLLQRLITKKQTVKKAVAETMKEYEPIPIDDSVLLYYPNEAGDQIIGDIKNSH